MAPVLARLKANARPQGRLARSLELAGAGLPVEGVASDPRTGRLIFSAVGGRRLLALEADGAVRPFGAAAADGGLYGLAADPSRNLLWAAQAAGPRLPGAGSWATALLRLDLTTGAVLSRHPLALGGEHQLGDVAVGPDGAVYASDAIGGGVYRLRPGARSLEPLVAPGLFGSPQGLAVMDRGRVLIVADYPTGLHRIDLASGAVARLAEPGAATLTGTDGVARDGEDLIVTQNGAEPQRVLRVRLDPEARRIRRIETLLANPELAGGPADIALGTVAGRSFVFVARSGWAGADQAGRLSAAAAAAPALIGWISF
jgi:sugar lactone lactonase YvrE